MLALFLVFVALGRMYRGMARQPETKALLLSAVVVVLAGVLFYTNVEGWSVLDALYFCVVTLGTVGYGDITPTTPIGKIFTIFYIIVGLAIIGGFLATAAQVVPPGSIIRRSKKTAEDDIKRAEDVVERDRNGGEPPEDAKSPPGQAKG